MKHQVLVSPKYNSKMIIIIIMSAAAVGLGPLRVKVFVICKSTAHLEESTI